MTTPYAAYMRQFTARLQARMHSQSYACVAQQAEQHRQTAAGSVAEARMKELKELMGLHRRTFDPALKQKALGILQTLPLKSTDEDPHFAHTFAGLQACVHFGAVNSPTTFNFLNHLTRHTFLLDGHGVFQLYRLLEQLRHPQTGEVVQLLLPRTREVVDDLSCPEARRILEFLAKNDALDVELSRKLTAVLQASLPDASVKELGYCVGVVHRMNSAEVARSFLSAAAPRICQALQESVAQRHYYKTLYRVEDVDLVAPSSPSLSSFPFSSNSAQERQGGGASLTSAERDAARATRAELMAFLVAEQRAAARLLLELVNAVTTLSWGPRRVLNEMVRTAVVWTEPASLSSLSAIPLVGKDETVAGYDDSSNGGGDGGAVPLFNADVFEEVETKDYEEYMQKLPQLQRFQLCTLMKALHFASYRHPTGLRLLSARVAAMQPDEDNGDLTEMKDGLALAIEAVAYFYATDCLPAVLSMLQEMQSLQLAPLNASITARMSAAPNGPHLLTKGENHITEVIVLRSLVSCARLLTACVSAATSADTSLPSNGPVEPQHKQQLCQHMVTFLTSPLLQLYVRHAQLLSRQEASSVSLAVRRHHAGAAHVLHSIVALFCFAAGDGSAAAFVARAGNLVDAASLEVLRTTLRDLVLLMHAVAERQPKALTREVAQEARAALEMVQRHPEWLPDSQDCS